MNSSEGKCEGCTINRRLVNDWIRLQNWVATKKLDYRTEWELRCHEMDSHEMAEKQGYSQALSEIHDEMCRLMNDCPDLNAHRNYRKGLGQLDD
jgi:hypothetical protein